MARRLITGMLMALIAAVGWSQSLQDNEYYRKMVELKALSEEAFDEGDYLEARRLAEEARSYKEQSDEWIENQLAAYRARSALVRVKDRLAEASMLNAEANFPEAFAEGRELYDRAYGEFRGEEYVQSRETSLEALEVLSVIEGVGRILPAYYTVRLLPGNTDCLWNIAGYDFIYGDPYQWRLIYEANADALPETDNPHLILPEMVLKIPARSGEVRTGTWTEGSIR